ncbi:MAG: hypothetical protein WCX28_12680 [Bacteriovoracaceae bacterium]|nr:hypothetical protein [Bacteroidota bacterium]
MNKYSLFVLSIVSIFLVVSINSCTDGTTESEKKDENINTGFLFRVVVKNSSGAPVQGIRVSAYNDPSIGGFPKYQKVSGSEKAMSQSTINYALPRFSRVTLSIYEMDGMLVQQPVLNMPAEAGMYNVSLSINSNTIGTRVYKAVLRVLNDTTQALLFTDSISIVLWQPDASVSVVGYSSNSGVVETGDSLAFPHLLNLPTLTHTTEKDPTPVGEIIIPSQVVITLTDTTTKKSVTFKRTVVHGKNEFGLTWSSAVQPFALSPYLFPNIFHAVKDTSISDVVPTAFRLQQNYPNPFN